LSTLFSKLIISFIIIFNFSGCFDSKHKFYKLTCGNNETTKVKYTEENEGEVICTSTAKVYNMNIDGVFIEPSDEIVKKCIEILNNGDIINKYCEDMTSPRSTNSFIVPINLANHLLENGYNPTDPDVERRINLALEKLLDTFEESKEELGY